MRLPPLGTFDQLPLTQGEMRQALEDVLRFVRGVSPDPELPHEGTFVVNDSLTIQQYGDGIEAMRKAARDLGLPVGLDRFFISRLGLYDPDREQEERRQLEELLQALHGVLGSLDQGGS